MASLPRSRVAFFLFGSGFAALAYQQVWLRTMREIFGASTPASAAVLAVFMGGLGAGGLILGRQADRTDNPLRLYARLELGVALAAALSPALLALARALYQGMGGTAALGDVGGTALRILLAVLVLGLPTFLMGGTLPAAVRAVERADDRGRTGLGMLYGANTLGAVSGTAWATFSAFESLGVQKTLWLAAVLNLLIAAAAETSARSLSAAVPDTPSSTSATILRAPHAFVFVAAAIAGFAFLEMELVWYRMLGPLLAGSSYTFGLVLMVALAGIGLGGLLYGRRDPARPPDLGTFGLTCALEAAFLLAPFAAGDRIALVAEAIRPLSVLGFGALVSGWTLITGGVIFGAAVVSGYQLPLLVALLGEGKKDVGRDVGLAYAWNTGGAIAGSLLGGFVLLPMFGAPALWRGTGLLLAMTAVCSLALAPPDVRRRRALAVLSVVGLTAVLSLSEGPTAVWRHTAVGALGWGNAVALSGPNDWENWRRFNKRSMVAEWEGREASVALRGADGLAFFINGKSDGHALHDAPTQVFLGLVGPMLHPDPKRAFVVGLGTGSTAGWLGAVPSIQEVVVAELEPAIVEIAQACEPVNAGVLKNNRVNVVIGDGREVLSTADGRFDVIVSEPSHPYRAGIASLFTVDFYEAVEEKLAEGGIFLQWVQGYGVDGPTVETIYATLQQVFPSVETWELARGADLVLVASRQPIQHDLARVQARSAVLPYNQALDRVLGVSGAAGFYTGYLGGPGLAAGFIEGTPVNSDDQPILEFRLARGLGITDGFSIEALRTQAGGVVPVALDAVVLAELLTVRDLMADRPVMVPEGLPQPVQTRALARARYQQGDLTGAWALWQQHGQPQGPADLLMQGELLAFTGHPGAESTIQANRARAPALGDALTARWLTATGNLPAAASALADAFIGFREDAWLYEPLVERSLSLAATLGQRDPALASALFAVLSEPFAVHILDEKRFHTRLELAFSAGFTDHCVQAFSPVEPNTPWTEDSLTARAWCYREADHALADQAAEDLTAFLVHAPRGIGE